MPFFELFFLAISMAMDAFAVCLAAGSLNRTQGPRPVFRLSFHFGLFQFIMPVLGWLAGARLEPLTKGYDRWVVFGLLSLIGVRMIYSALSGEESRSTDPSRGLTLVLLSIAEPLHFSSANLPTAKGKTTNSNFLGGNSRLAFCHDRSKMMFAFR